MVYKQKTMGKKWPHVQKIYQHPTDLGLMKLEL